MLVVWDGLQNTHRCNDVKPLSIAACKRCIIIVKNCPYLYGLDVRMQLKPSR